MSGDAELLALLAEHLVLTAAPAVFAVLLAARLGLRSLTLLLGVALLASGASAMLVFWAFFGFPVLGQTVSFMIVLGSLGGIAWLGFEGGFDRALLRRLAVPLALWALASVFIAFLGFDHGGIHSSLELASTRFSQELPTDNAIPRYFADWFYVHGHDGTPPPFADWLSSDRPPLQIGYTLAQRPFGWDAHDLHYQLIGIVLQQLWVLGAWAVLCAARLRPLPRALGMIAALVSDIAIVHGFFVWPKLLAAAFLLAALAMVLDGDWRRWSRQPWAGALFAGLLALAMLAHGSSVFFAIPLLGLAALRAMPSWRWLGVALLVGFVLLAPWSAYQRWFDPPGDRLIKWQLGGSLEIDDRGSLQTIVDGYREAGLGGALENKWGNVTQLLGAGEVHKAIVQAGDGDLGNAIIAIRFPRFFSLLPCIGFLLIGPLAMLCRYLFRSRAGPPGGPEWSFALTALGLLAAACLVWVLLMFGGPGSGTTIHVGSLAVPLLALSACAVGAYASWRPLGIGLVAFNAAFVLFLYAPELSPPPGSSYSVLAIVLAAAGLLGFATVSLRAR
ncbi:MAG TPA: hypothetical protein VMT37_07415 [Solirubrobacterales bacterium]|nr:hypothetical protein [Solirubrobacterales bacterium]